MVAVQSDNDLSIMNSNDQASKPGENTDDSSTVTLHKDEARLKQATDEGGEI